MFKNAFYYLFFDGVNKLIPFIVAPLISAVLGISAFGEYSTKLVVYNLCIVMFGWGVNSYALVEYSKNKNEFQIFTDCSSIIVRNFIILLPLIILLSFIFDGLPIYECLGISISSFVFCFVQVKLSELQSKNRVFEFGLVNLSLTSMLMISVLISIYILDSIYYLWTINSLLYLTHLIFIGYGPKNTSFKKNCNKLVSSFCLHQLPHLLSNWVRLGVDRIFLALFLSSTDVGIYSIALQYGLVLSVISQSLNRAWTPFLFKKLSLGGGEFTIRRSVIIISLLIISISILLYFPSIYSLAFIFPDFDLKHSYLIGMVLVGYCFHGIYLLNSNYLFYFDKTKELSKASVLTTLIHSICSFILIPVYGFDGAVIALSVGWFFQVVFLFILLRSYKTWSVY